MITQRYQEIEAGLPPKLSESDRSALWRKRMGPIDYEVFDQAVGAYDWYCLEAIRDFAKEQGYWVRNRKDDADLRSLRAELDPPFAKRLFLWHKTKNDIVQEMDSVMQMPGWGNIWTQPIINRVDMLATGVRTMIGVKVFGDDLNTIQRFQTRWRRF